MPVGGKRRDLECQATDEIEVALSDPTILAAVGTLGGVDKRTVLLDGSVNITFTQGIRTRSAPVDEPMETPSQELATWSKIPAQNPNALF